MEVVNPFILKNKSRMIKYIDELATFPNGYQASSVSLEPDLVIKGQPDRELANILSICESHLHQIQAQAHNRVSRHTHTHTVDSHRLLAARDTLHNIVLSAFFTS